MSTAERDMRRAQDNEELRLHLADGEQIRLAARDHWIVLVPSSAIAIAVSALSVYLLLTSTPRANSTLPRDLAVGCGVAWLYAGWCWLARRHDLLIVTDKRILRFRGIISTDVPMMRISKITDMRYHRSPMGELFGYGEVTIESAGQEQALRELKWLPDPLENYHRLCEVVFGEKHGAARKSHKWRDRISRVSRRAKRAAGRRPSFDSGPVIDYAEPEALGGHDHGGNGGAHPGPIHAPSLDLTALPAGGDHPAYSRAIPVTRRTDTPRYIPRHRLPDPDENPPAGAAKSETLYKSPDLREDPARTQSIWVDPDHRGQKS